MASITLYDVDIDLSDVDMSSQEQRELTEELMSELSSSEIEELLDKVGYEQPMDEDVLAGLYNNCLSISEQKEFLSQIGALEMDTTDLGIFTQLYDNLEDADKVTFRENLDLSDIGLDQQYENLTEYQKADFQVNHELTTNKVYDELFSKVRHFFEVMRELNQVTKP